MKRKVNCVICNKKAYANTFVCQTCIKNDLDKKDKEIADLKSKLLGYESGFIVKDLNQAIQEIKKDIEDKIDKLKVYSVKDSKGNVRDFVLIEDLKSSLGLNHSLENGKKLAEDFNKKICPSLNPPDNSPHEPKVYADKAMTEDTNHSQQEQLGSSQDQVQDLGKSNLKDYPRSNKREEGNCIPAHPSSHTPAGTNANNKGDKEC